VEGGRSEFRHLSLGATMCLTRRQRSFLLQVKGSNGKQLKLGSRGCLKGALTNTRRLH